MKCTFCKQKEEDFVQYREKPICKDCFKDIFNWSKHKQINDKLNKIYKLIEDYIK